MKQSNAYGRDYQHHLVITTQSVSPRVIIRLIKAHFPTRMAFRVFSKAESKIIIGTPGAECLAGSGDMILAYDGEVCRIQGAYADREDMEDLPGTAGDSLFDAACHIAQKSGLSSVSLLQRELCIGYTRAARLKEALDNAGIVKSGKR